MIRAKIEQRIEDVRQLQSEGITYDTLSSIRNGLVPTRVVHTATSWGVKNYQTVRQWMGLVDGLRTFAMAELLAGRLQIGDAISLLGLDGKSKKAQVEAKLGEERVRQLLEAPPMGAPAEEPETVDELTEKVRTELAKKVNVINMDGMDNMVGVVSLRLRFAKGEVDQTEASITVSVPPSSGAIEPVDPEAVEQGSLI